MQDISVFYSSLSFYSIVILLSFFRSFNSSTIDGQRGCLLSSSPPLFINHSLPPLLFLSVFSDVSPACQTSLSSSCSFLLLCKMIWFTHEPPFLLSSCPRCIFSLLQYSFFSCDTFFIYFSSFNLYSNLCFPVMYLLLSLMLSFLFFLPSIFRLSSHSLNRLTHFLCPPFCLLFGVWETNLSTVVVWILSGFVKSQPCL